MKPLSPAFRRANIPHYGLSTFTMLLFVLAIDEDRQRRENERRRRRKALSQVQCRPAEDLWPQPS